MKLVIDIDESDYKELCHTVMSIDEMDNTTQGRVYGAIVRGGMKKLSSVDPNVPVTNVGDLISRQAAIDAIWKPIIKPNEMIFDALKQAQQNEIETLPSVEPEKCGDYIEKQKAISELQPPTDNWENYADRLYDLAYLSGYNDGLIAKGTQNNV